MYFFFYLIKLRDKTTGTEINILLLRAPYGRDIPTEIYQKAELLRKKNKQQLFKTTCKFTMLYIGALVVVFVAMWILRKQ